MRCSNDMILNNDDYDDKDKDVDDDAASLLDGCLH